MPLNSVKNPHGPDQLKLRYLFLWGLPLEPVEPMMDDFSLRKNLLELDVVKFRYLRPLQHPLAPVDLSLGDNLLGPEGVKCRYPYHFGIPLALVEPAIVHFSLGEELLELK